MERRKKEVPLFSLRESQIQKAILQLLAAEHVFAMRLNTGAFRAASGVPVYAHSGGKGVSDIISFPIVKGMLAGKPVTLVSVLWIEVKGPKGKQSLEQENFQQRVEEEGHYYLLARSSDDVLGWLRTHGASK